jgi:hypothetical protein
MMVDVVKCKKGRNCCCSRGKQADDIESGLNEHNMNSSTWSPYRNL